MRNTVNNGGLSFELKLSFNLLKRIEFEGSGWKENGSGRPSSLSGEGFNEKKFNFNIFPSSESFY